MQLITHQIHINKLPESPLKTHIQSRYDSLTFETDMPPNIIVVEKTDDIFSPQYAFIGNRGLLSDLYEKHEPREDGFTRPYEWVFHHAELKLYELMLLQHSEDGYFILIPDDVAEAHPDLKWVLTAEELGGLSEPQPL